MEPLVSSSFSNNNLQADNERKGINRKNWKIQSKTVGWNCVEIFTCACECVCVGGVIVAYYCVWMCKGCLVYVYVKIHAQSNELGIVYQIGECSCSKPCYSRGEKKLFNYFYMCRWL